MLTSDFGSNSPGQLVKNLNGVDCFVPSSLPPTLKWSSPLAQAIANAHFAIGRICGNQAVAPVPNPHRLVRMFMRREAELSSIIENTYAGVQTMLLYEQVPEVRRKSPDVQEVQNNFLALEYGIASLEHRPITLSLIKEMHAILLRNVRGHDKTPGQFRTVQAHIGSSDDIHRARFVPAPPHQIQEAMTGLETYINTNDGLPTVFRAAMVHYQFEAIHPFADGNGRIGRVLLLLQLIKEGLIPAPLLNPSAQLEQNRREYYDGLLSVSHKGEWESWLIFFASCLKTEAETAAERIGRFNVLLNDYKRRILIPRASTLLLPLVEHLMGEPAINNEQVRNLFSITETSARKLITRLEALKILREVTGQARNRVYIAQEVVDLFSSSNSHDHF